MVFFMKNILVIGAGLSSSYLIKYLLEQANIFNWQITIADSNIEAAESKIANQKNAKAIKLNATDNEQVEQLVSANDLIISLLPAFMHIYVARNCVSLKKHLITASYVSPEMQSLHNNAINNDVLLLNECGLDPGIDHLSAMKIIDEVKAKGGSIDVFKSFCGGLVAPEFDDNPWNYKFTWNPRNVVVAGQSTAQYLEQNELKFIPPQRIFTQTEEIQIENQGSFECYANRDSLSYIKPYGIESAHTVLRGTLRKKGYSKAWNNIVKLGLTDDSFVIHNTQNLTYRELVSAFTPGNDISKLEQRACDFLNLTQEQDEFKKLVWLGLFDDTKINIPEGSPAFVLQQLLQQKWKLQKGELDMIVMYHEIEASYPNKKEKISSALVVKGENEILTAMSKTVGLPMAIAAKHLMLGDIKLRGVVIPTMPELYNPILIELAEYGISFEEKCY
jgi:saccharopine dehydrogenase-like NADP-dependent oxidoreductase